MTPTRMKLITAVLSACLAACGGYGGGSYTAPGGPSAPSATINATPSQGFSPNSVTIAPGGTVTFAFGSVGHSVKFDTGTNPPADITGVNADTSISRTFSTAGTFTFHCTIHPTETGTVIVAATTTTNPPGYNP